MASAALAVVRCRATEMVVLAFLEGQELIFDLQYILFSILPSSHAKSINDLSIRFHPILETYPKL